MSIKNILLTNDDGIYAKGFFDFAILLKSLGYKVIVAAPKEHMSCSSHNVSTFSPIKYTKLDNINNDIEVYAIEGTPCDCVKFTLEILVDKRNIDLVISGINNVMNVGNDLFYSGTTSARKEGVLNSKKAIAISQDEFGYGFESSFAFIKNNLKTLINILQNDEIDMLSINIPSHDSNKINGIKIATVGVKLYDDTYILKDDGKYYMKGKRKDNVHTSEDSDVYLTDRGYITISPIKVEFLDKIGYEKLINRKIEWKY